MEIDVKKLISTESNKERIAEDLEGDVINKIKWELDDVISKEIKKFVVEEIAPTVIAELAGKKKEIVEQIKKDIVKVVAKLGEAMLAKSIENLDNGWTVRDITGKLFN